MNKYQRGKALARDRAIEWQQRYFSGDNPPPLSYGELYEWQQYFQRLGRRYGLLREFRENCIC